MCPLVYYWHEHVLGILGARRSWMRCSRAPIICYGNALDIYILTPAGPGRGVQGRARGAPAQGVALSRHADRGGMHYMALLSCSSQSGIVEAVMPAPLGLARIVPVCHVL